MNSELKIQIVNATEELEEAILRLIYDGFNIEEINKVLEIKGYEARIEIIEECFSEEDFEEDVFDNSLLNEVEVSEEEINDFFSYLFNNQEIQNKMNKAKERKEQKQEETKIDLKDKLNQIDIENKEKIILDKLRVLSEELNTKKIDWNNLSQQKYYINLDYTQQVIHVKSTLNRQIGVIYFDSEEKAYKALSLLRNDLLELI